jgi:hypothetical protein
MAVWEATDLHLHVMMFWKYLATKYLESWCCSWRLDLFRTGKTYWRRRDHNRCWSISAVANENLCANYQENFRQIQFWCDTRNGALQWRSPLRFCILYKTYIS